MKRAIKIDQNSYAMIRRWTRRAKWTWQFCHC